MTLPRSLFLTALIGELQAHPVNHNACFQAFAGELPPRAHLRRFFLQYHYFCKQFVKVLEGLLYRTPVDELEMRIELVKTLHSELGEGRRDRAHLTLLGRFLGALGLSREDLIRTVPCPAVDDYLALLRRLFLESHYLVALGAELAVEVTAVSEFKYLYPALQRDPVFQPPDLEFFKLHLAEEESHGDWLVEAVRKTARTEHDQELVRAGARETADGWLRFWTGLHRAVLLHPPPGPAEPGIDAQTATSGAKTAPQRS